MRELLIDNGTAGRCNACPFQDIGYIAISHCGQRLGVALSNRFTDVCCPPFKLWTMGEPTKPLAHEGFGWLSDLGIRLAFKNWLETVARDSCALKALSVALIMVLAPRWWPPVGLGGKSRNRWSSPGAEQGPAVCGWPGRRDCLGEIQCLSPHFPFLSLVVLVPALGATAVELG